MHRLLLWTALLVAAVVSGAPTNDSNTSQDGSGTGKGLAYAESCQEQLWAFRNSSRSYGSMYGHSSTSLFSSEMSIVSYEPVSPTVTSLITLCDGHTRVVGQVTTRNASSTTYGYSWTNTNPIFIPAPYPTPEPCTIGPQDCELLQSSWTSHWDSITRNTPDFTEGLLAPPCTMPTAPEPSYSTNAAGNECDSCFIHGREIRLLFWPVTTVADSGNLCNKTAETVTATNTGSPRSLVTEGITITSPTVAMSIGGLSRADNCGPTVNHTIIPVLPEDVTSVQGARALFTHMPFNFADLNYKCLDDPDQDYITTGSRTDCYREVPASAYFLGYQNAAGAQWLDPNAFANRTIWPNYQPQVLIPATLTSAIESIWGPDCIIHPDGVWDPPIALQEETAFPLPKYAPGAPTSYYSPHTDAPQPGGPTTPHAPQQTTVASPLVEAQHEGHGPQPTGLGYPNEQWGAHQGGHDSGHHDNHHDDESSNEAHQADGTDLHDPEQGVLYTNIINYTSLASANADVNAPPHGKSGAQVFTVTSVLSGLAGGNSNQPSPTMKEDDGGNSDEVYNESAHQTGKTSEEILTAISAYSVSTIENDDGASASGHDDHGEAFNQQDHGDSSSQQEHGESSNQQTYGEPSSQQDHGEPSSQQDHGEPSSQQDHEELSSQQDHGESSHHQEADASTVEASHTASAAVHQHHEHIAEVASDVASPTAQQDHVLSPSRVQNAAESETSNQDSSSGNTSGSIDPSGSDSKPSAGANGDSSASTTQSSNGAGSGEREGVAPQSNIATSIAKTICFRLSTLAVAISILL